MLLWLAIPLVGLLVGLVTLAAGEGGGVFWLGAVSLTILVNAAAWVVRTELGPQLRARRARRAARTP